MFSNDIFGNRNRWFYFQEHILHMFSTFPVPSNRNTVLTISIKDKPYTFSERVR